MIYRLVSAGYATPGQSSRALLDSFEAEMILAFAYGLLVEKLAPEQRAEFDKTIDEMDSKSPEKLIEKELDDGRVVKISSARLDRIKQNLSGVQRMDPRKGG